MKIFGWGYFNQYPLALDGALSNNLTALLRTNITYFVLTVAATTKNELNVTSFFPSAKKIHNRNSFEYINCKLRLIYRIFLCFYRLNWKAIVCSGAAILVTAAGTSLLATGIELLRKRKKFVHRLIFIHISNFWSFLSRIKFDVFISDILRRTTPANKWPVISFIYNFVEGFFSVDSKRDFIFSPFKLSFFPSCFGMSTESN